MSISKNMFRVFEFQQQVNSRDKIWEKINKQIKKLIAKKTSVSTT